MSKNKNNVTASAPLELEQLLGKEITTVSFNNTEEALAAFFSLKDDFTALQGAVVIIIGEKNKLAAKVAELEKQIADQDEVIDGLNKSVETLEKVKQSKYEVVKDSEGNPYEVVVKLINVPIKNVNTLITTKKFIEKNPGAKKDNMLFLDDPKVVDTCVDAKIGNVKPFKSKE